MKRHATSLLGLLIALLFAHSAAAATLIYEFRRTNDPTVIAYATALLEGEDIDCFQMDVHMSVLEGSIGILPRRLMVADRDHFRARAILRDNDLPLED